jgi:hypothetical protein
LALHRGRDHAEALTSEEREAYIAALADEDRWLKELQRRVRGGLYAMPIGLTWFAFVVLAAVYGVLHWALIPAPGFVGFGLLVYYMAYQKDQAPPRHTV